MNLIKAISVIVSLTLPFSVGHHSALSQSEKGAAEKADKAEKGSKGGPKGGPKGEPKQGGGGAGLSKAEMQKRDNETIQKATEILKKEKLRDEVIKAVVEAIQHNPSENGVKVLERIHTMVLDRAGMCGNCEAERQASRARETEILLEVDRKLAAERQKEKKK